MTVQDFTSLTLRDAQTALRAGTVTAEELASAAQERIAAVEPAIKAFLRLTPTLSSAGAVTAAQARREELPPLAGLPIAVKDNLCTAGIETTAGSRTLSGYIPARDATVVSALKKDLANIVGKTNCDEFAMGSSTEQSAYGPTKNPLDLDRVPGGSSGGSAAAVAAGECLAALGSDTGGSVRQPAAFCGIVGLKPSYGRVSRSGLIALTSSTDVVGTLTKTTADAAVLLQAIAGADPADLTTQSVPVPEYLADLERPIAGLRIGVPQECMNPDLAPDIRQVIEQAIERYRSLGATVEACSLPLTPQGIWVYYILTPAEASANLSRYDGIRFPKQGGTDAVADSYRERIAAWRGRTLGAEPLRRILLGTYALSSGYYDAYYNTAQRVRQKIIQEYQVAFQKFDLLLTPATPSVAFPFGSTHDPLSLYLQDIFLVGPSLAGLPALTLPAGMSQHLPVSLQLIGPALGESVVLRAAHQFEQERGNLPLRLAV